MPTLRFDTFRGLYRPENLDIALSPNYLLQAQNMEYFPGEENTIKMRGRRGIKRLNNVTALDGKVMTIHRHYPRSADPQTLYAYQDDVSSPTAVNFKHDTDDDGEPEVLTGSFNADVNARWHYINYGQKNASYGVNGVNGLRKYDGSTLAEVTLGGGAFSATGSDIGPYITLWKQRIFVTKQDEINYSVYASDTNSDSEFPVANQLNFDDNQGGTITGIAAWNDVLLVFKDTAVFRFIGDIAFLDTSQQTVLSEYGCIAPETIKVTPYGVMYLARDGLRITDGQDTLGVELSQPIRTTFISPSSQTVFSDAIADYTPRKHMYISKLAAARDLDVIQRVEVEEGATWNWAFWTKSDMGDVSAIHVGQSDVDNGKIFFGDTNGKLWEADVADQETDLEGNTTSDIELVVQTAFTRLSAGLQFGRVVRSRLAYRGKGVAVVEIRYDNEISTAEQISVGWSYDQPQLQYWDRVHHHPQAMGQWVSAVITLPAESYNAELHYWEADVKLRGLRMRNKNISQSLSVT